jgi:hypothetical protein
MSRGILISVLNISTNSDSTDMMECPRVKLRTTAPPRRASIQGRCHWPAGRLPGGLSRQGLRVYRVNSVVDTDRFQFCSFRRHMTTTPVMLAPS